MGKMLKIECQYDGLSSAKSGITTVKFRAPYGEIVNYIKLFGYINMDLKLGVKPEHDAKFQKLGDARIKAITINKEGDARIQFYGEAFDIECVQSLMDKTIIIGLKAEGEDDV